VMHAPEGTSKAVSMVRAICALAHRNVNVGGYNQAASVSSTVILLKGIASLGIKELAQVSQQVCVLRHHTCVSSVPPAVSGRSGSRLEASSNASTLCH
jgi:hypothetical protein